MTTTATTPNAERAPGLTQEDLDALVEPHLQAAVAPLQGPAPLLSGMARYHLGWVDERLRPVVPDLSLRGKRMRPGIALLTCAAAGADPSTAAPLAAAIELLHNFTLIHDDIQDQSLSRRHRSTVWSIWGVGQAINAGDALFAAAHRALYRLRETGTPDSLILRLVDAFDQMTIDIVTGQVLDLEFEERADVTADEYLTMIAGKTAAIIRFAAWAGALLAAAPDERAERFAAFGLALGLGFQVRDDLLGIWGTPDATGKAPADDIRRRKQTLPVLMLRDCLSEQERSEVRALYQQSEVGEQGIKRLLSLFDQYGVREIVEERISAYHDQARTALDAAVGPNDTPARETLLTTVAFLATRTG